MRYTSVQDVFDAFRNVKILVIGDVMIDAYTWAKVDRLSPEAPVPVIKPFRKEYRLGGAGNAVKNLLALECHASLIALSGNNDSRLKQLLEQNLLSPENVIPGNRPVTVKERVFGNNQHLLRMDEEDDSPATDAETALLKARVLHEIKDADAVLFEDYDKGTITPELISYTIELAKEKGIPVVVDPKFRNFHAYEQATLFKPNLKELKQGLKVSEEVGLHNIEKYSRVLMENLGVEKVLVTLSSDGVFVCTRNKKVHLKAHRRDIADVSGAGDTVVSIATACMALALPDEFTASLSNLGGGLVCEHVGVVPVNRNRLLDEAQKFSLPYL